MSLNPNQFREYVDSVLGFLNPVIPYSKNARELLVLTAAAETALGNYLWQNGGTMQDGPARGIFQMEVNTEDLLRDFIAKNLALQDLIEKTMTAQRDNMVHSLAYQTAMARIYYWTKPGALPDYRDVEGMAKYWKKYWNTYLGKGTVEKAVEMYIRLAGNAE